MSNLPSRNFRIGVFVVGGLLALAAGVFLVGDKEMLFSSTYTVKAQFPNVAGLIEGANVRVGGVRQGTVKHIDLPPDPRQNVTVVMGLKSATRNIVKKDSVASIKSEGLLGDKYVEITFGSEDGEKLQDGSMVSAAPPLDISDLMQKTDQVLDGAKQAVENISGTAGNLKSVSAKIDRGEGTIGALINDKTMYRQVNAGATAFQEDMEALKHNFFLRGFFKKRGYEDASELGKYAVARLPGERPTRTFSYETEDIFNKTDTAKLKSKKPLNEAGEFLQGQTFGLAVVVARGSAIGDSDKLLQLTQAQALVVREYLVQNFKLDDARVKTFGSGKAQPGTTADRIEVLVYPAGTGAADKTR